MNWIKKGSFYFFLASAAVLIALLILYFLLPDDPEIMEYTDRAGQPRTQKTGRQYAVVTGTPWAARTAMSILEDGGNACDAAVGALLAINVTHGEAASFVGVAPAMYYDAETGAVKSYIGAGKAPTAATLEAFRARGWAAIPPTDIWAQLVPASPDVLVRLLQDCGTKSFIDVSSRPVQIARKGFPMHATMYSNLDISLFERIAFHVMMPENLRVWLKGQFWRPFRLHERLTFPDLADTLEEMAAAEQAVIADGGTRLEGLEAVRDYFYKGPIAEKIVAFHEKAGGLFSLEDLATYAGSWEAPIRASYREYTFFGNGSWSQGIMEPLALQILEGINLEQMKHNSTDYVHTVTQAIELAMVDRDGYLGDNSFVDVPMDVLLSKSYAAQRQMLMTPDRAFGKLPPPGRIAGFDPFVPDAANASRLPESVDMTFAFGQDTSQLVVIDKEGNTLVMTPSDFPKTPMVPGTGINLGTRMEQFYLDPDSPNALAPGKRPRITPHAVVVFKNGKFWIAYSTPGGDMQSQALVQVFLNIAVFGMDLQEAISAPRFYSITAPSSFYPHDAHPGHLRLEADLFNEIGAELSAKGYTVEKDPAWNKDFGAVGAIMVDAEGRLHAGADPRAETTAIAK